MEHEVVYCVNCQIVECTELLCPACLDEVVEDMAERWSEQGLVDGGLY